MEEEAERIFKDERVLLREDEAASARDTMLVKCIFFLLF
jgi:nuclear pore complex protein Nup62